MENINSTIDLRLKMAWYQNNSTTSNDALVATDKNYDDELIELVRNKFLDEIKYANYKYGENNSAQSSRRPRQL